MIGLWWTSPWGQWEEWHTWYLSFFLHEQNFWRVKFTPKKRVNYDKIQRKLPIFLRYLGKIHSKLPIVCLKSVKIYTSQKNFTRIYSWRSWEIWGMIIPKYSRQVAHYILVSIFLSSYSLLLDLNWRTILFSQSSTISWPSEISVLEPESLFPSPTRKSSPLSSWPPPPSPSCSCPTWAASWVGQLWIVWGRPVQAQYKKWGL